MGRTLMSSTMNAMTFFGLFFCFSLFVGPSLSHQCYTCVGAIGLKCDDANPGDKTDCSGPLASDYCILLKLGDLETRSCGAGNLAGTGAKEGCTTTSVDGHTAKTCLCKGELCNETWKKAGSSAAPVYISSLALSFYIASLFL